ncbi:hypothetical protein [Pseudomonas veronii]
MTQPFDVADDQTSIKGAIIVESDRFAVFGAGLPEDFGKDAQEKADLLERRLSRLEQALGLPSLSIAGVDSSEALAAAIRNADLIPELLKPLSGQ